MYCPERLRGLRSTNHACAKFYTSRTIIRDTNEFMEGTDPLGPRPPPPRRRLLAAASRSSASPPPASATKAMNQKFSVPGREGWETNQQIAQHYRGTGGNSAPLMPVVTLPAGQTAADPASARDLRADRAARGAGAARLARGRLRLHRRPRRSSPRTGARPSSSPTRRPIPTSPSATTRRPRRRLRAALQGATVGGRAGPPLGLRRARSARRGGGDGPGVLVEALLGGFGALLVLAFVFGSLLAFVPLLMAIPAIMTSFLAVYGLTHGHRRLADRAVPDRADRARRGDRLRADHRRALARGARPRRRRATRRSCARWRPPGAPSSSRARRSRSACSRSSCCRCRSCARSATAGMLIPLDLACSSRSRCCPSCCTRSGRRLDWPHRRTDDKASRAWTRWAQRRRPPPLAGGRRRAAHPRARSSLAATNLQPGHLRTSTRSPSPATPRRASSRSSARASASGALLPYEILVRGAVGADAVARGGRRRRRHPRRGRARPRWRAGGTAVVDAFADARRLDARRPRPGRRGPQRRARRRARRAGVGGAAAAERGLHRRRLRQLPADDRADRGAHVRAARARVPLAAAAAEGRDAEHHQRRAPPGACWSSSGSRATARSCIWGIAATGSITAWIPLMVFAFLFGLSMDYEVFILARMREEYDATGDTDEAVDPRHRPHRAAGDERRADPVPRLRVAGLGPGDRRQGARDRPGRGHPARRHGHPRAARARRRVAVRPLELVLPPRPGARCCASSRRCRRPSAPRPGADRRARPRAAPRRSRRSARGGPASTARGATGRR